MASSLLAGDRRWASARKSGMTVLGKVPKPINLPSQRLENNGLDPNVEIVPKGTLTWGSRPSSAVPNAWSSSSLLSPKTDGSTGSPSHTSGRPSSGGSGTRPSTAGSDRSHEPPSNAWGPNSRPSSASGLSATNQTSIVATRPRSAETRPGNSQLSRFAENSADSTVAWGSTRTTERVGPPTSKTNGFTLSSGDFPTLGSDKNSESHSQRGHSSQGHCASASDTDAAPKEKLESPLSGDAKIAAFSEQEIMNTQKKDNYLYVGGGPPLNMNWQMEPQHAQQYPSLNMTAHQFDSWHGPPLHSPDGIWYRGGGPGGPYRPASPHGGFAADHFGYYPQFPQNTEAVPGPGAGQCGFHPNNGATYRPHVPPPSFMVASHPVLPARPGVYQAPVPYDGYRGMPQVGFCGYSERDVPFMGVACQPGVYDHHPHQNGNLNPGQFHVGRRDPPMAKERMQADRAHGIHKEQYKVCLKQRDGWEDNKLQEMRQAVISNPPHFDKVSKPGGSTQEECWHTDSRKDEHAALVNTKPDSEGLLKPSHDCEDHSSEPATVDLQENSDKAADGVLMRRPETATSLAHDRQQYPVTKKNAALIEKIEGLNNKARCADSHNEVTPFSFREEKTKQLKAATRKADRSTKVICSNVIPTENGPSFGMVIPASSEVNSSAIDNDFKSSSDGKAVPGPSESQIIAVGKSDSSKYGEVAHSHNYRRNNTTRTRVDYHVKSRTNNQVDDGWTKESPGKDYSVITAVTNGDGLRVGVPDDHSSQDTAVMESDHAIISGSYTSAMDSLDYQTQRAKMKEIAAQRAKQLQKEEEERTREQRAKALAKLEELNRRSLVQSSKQKSNDSIQPSIDMQHNQDSGAGTALKIDVTNNEVPGVMSEENSDALIHENDSELRNLPTPADLPSDIASEDPAISHDPSPTLRQENNTTVVVDQKMSSHVHDSNISRHKHISYRRKQSISMEKNPGEKSNTAGNMECRKDLVEVAVDASNDSLPYNEGPVHKKKNNRNSRNKNKLEEALMGSTTPSLAHTDGNIEKGPSDCQKTHSPASVAETLVVPAQNSCEISGPQVSRDVMVTSSNRLSKSTEEAHGRIGNQWKPQPPRKSSRNQQGFKPADKFHVSDAVIWAPVKPQNKNEQQPEEISQSSMIVASSQSLGKKEHDMHNGKKAKRAEMERYIPKPVTKEMSQQPNCQQPSPSLEQEASGDKSEKSEFDSRILDRGGPDDLAVGEMEFLADTKNVEENKPNRRGRGHASWCQRSSAESTSALQSTGEGSGSSGAAKVIQKPSDQDELLNPDRQLQKFKSDGWDSNSAKALPTELIAAPAGVQDHGVTSRQRHQQFKVNRVAGSNHIPAGNKDSRTGIDDKSDIQNPAPGLNEPDIRNASKTENKISGGEHMKSHWKPKSHANSHNQGHRGSGGQKVAFHSGRSDKEFAFEGFDGHPLQEDNALTQKNRVGECYQEAQGDMKFIVDPSKQQTHTLNQEVPINAELGPENVKAHHEHEVTPAPRQHNGRFNRGQEAVYRGRDSGQDAGRGRQNFLMNGERRKHNSHYEYQPIGSYGKPSESSQWNPDVSEEAQEGSRPPGLRYRERSQNHSRRSGHFFRRSGGAAVRGGEPINIVEKEF
ncbi:protein MODIFIER OF SNC1 1 isoform X1 [Elaeis guineensis]|uniref:protein MODIFIER OF SNC1 1 isoform X1 n=2 Tax=Elaeis guineensis var. tenera TaxID=51953 RepID=UPI003C6D9DD0